MPLNGTPVLSGEVGGIDVGLVRVRESCDYTVIIIDSTLSFTWTGVVRSLNTRWDYL